MTMYFHPQLGLDVPELDGAFVREFRSFRAAKMAKRAKCNREAFQESLEFQQSAIV